MADSPRLIVNTDPPEVTVEASGARLALTTARGTYEYVNATGACTFTTKDAS